MINKKKKTENKHPHHKLNTNIKNVSSQHVFEKWIFFTRIDSFVITENIEIVYWPGKMLC